MAGGIFKETMRLERILGTVLLATGGALADFPAFADGKKDCTTAAKSEWCKKVELFYNPIDMALMKTVVK